MPPPPHMADKASVHRPREGLVKLEAGTQGVEVEGVGVFSTLQNQRDAFQSSAIAESKDTVQERESCRMPSGRLGAPVGCCWFTQCGDHPLENQRHNVLQSSAEIKGGIDVEFEL